MISIVISEKGGVERRENYDQSEITVGRVKGNDVLLPKGNVSKRHARLIVRDGRYIVTDLKSTNGTYVNHRRITHATLVREGDRIYIGDFVLRIEAPEGDASESTETHSSMPGSGHLDDGLRNEMSNQITAAPPVPDREDIVSHFPIEHDPDESLAASGLPAPPPIPSGLRENRPAVSPLRSHAPTPARLYRRPSGELVANYGVEPSSAATTNGSRTGFPTSADNRLQRANEALVRLTQSVEEHVGVERLAVVKPDAALAKDVDDALKTAVDALIEDSSSSAALSTDDLHQAARQELLEMGPLTRALNDDSFTRVRVWCRRVSLEREGNKAGANHLDFGTDAGVERAVARLCAGSSVDLSEESSHLEANAVRGFHFSLLRPPLCSDGYLLTLKRRLEQETTLDSLVRQGTLSRGMAKLLDRCARGGGSVLVIGAADCGADQLMDALANSLPKQSSRLWLCNRPSEPVSPNIARVVLGEETDVQERRSRLEAALSVGCDHLVVPASTYDALPQVLDSLPSTTAAVLCSAQANTLNRGIEMLTAQIATQRPELSPATARQWLLSGFDIAVEVVRLGDGRSRITRLVELRPDRHPALRDVFNFSYERTVSGGSMEGSFTSTGLVPRIVQDLAARGMPIDQGLFRRQGV